MERYIKMGFASLLLIMLLALGGLAATESVRDGAVAALLSNAHTVAQKVETKPAVTIPTGDVSTTSASSTALGSTAQQVGGIVDARPAVKLAGPAVVTVVNNMQPQTQQSPFGGGTGTTS